MVTASLKFGFPLSKNDFSILKTSKGMGPKERSFWLVTLNSPLTSEQVIVQFSLIASLFVKGPLAKGQLVAFKI